MEPDIFDKAEAEGTNPMAALTIWVAGFVMTLGHGPAVTAELMRGVFRCWSWENRRRSGQLTREEAESLLQAAEDVALCDPNRTRPADAQVRARAKRKLRLWLDREGG